MQANTFRFRLFFGFRLFLAAITGILLLLSGYCTSHAVPKLVKSPETLMEIPEIRTIASSETHLYVLSEREGLMVFRTTTNSLQWLYNSSGLANRGHRLVTDIRFSYLFGREGRITVIEPTSVLGVYSSTQLLNNPNDVIRVNSDLFIADNDHGIRKLSLETSESVDTPPEPVFNHDRPIISVAQISRQLFALDDQNRLFVFEYENGNINPESDHQLPGTSGSMHVVGNRLYMTTPDGEIFRIRTDGRSDKLFGIDEAVTHLKWWNENYLIRGESNRIWIAHQGLTPTLFRDDPNAGNHITTFKGQLWISEYQQLCRWVDADHIARFEESEEPDQVDTIVPDRLPEEPLRIAPIDNQIIPYPRPLLVAFSLESNHDISTVRFQQKSRINDIRIDGNSLYWQPSAGDAGTHTISVVATSLEGQTDSTSFRVNVRPFNTPPRFSPVRPLSITVNEEFSIPFQATDPDGIDKELIRYIGVDLPEKASLDERSGEFVWTPSRRQAGEHKFQIIATDQYGAASSLDVTINVVDLSREEP